MPKGFLRLSRQREFFNLVLLGLQLQTKLIDVVLEVTDFLEEVLLQVKQVIQLDLIVVLGGIALTSDLLNLILSLLQELILLLHSGKNAGEKLQIGARTLSALPALQQKILKI
jgi:hypothetical protein